MTKAANKLGLTTSAVSRRIRELEMDLGTDLFTRFNRRLELTVAGTRLAAAAGSALDDIGNAIDDVRIEHPLKTIRITTMPAFASAWLVPRLAGFRAVRPDLEIEVSTGIGFTDFSAGHIHAGIRFGLGRWPGLLAEKLLDVSFLPYCSPAAIGEWGPVTPAGLDRFTFLSMSGTPDLWTEWLASNGLEGYLPKSRQSFDSIHVLYETAAAGLGIALGEPLFMADHVKGGRLTPAFEIDSSPSKYAYYFVNREQENEWLPLQALKKSLLRPQA